MTALASIAPVAPAGGPPAFVPAPWHAVAILTVAIFAAGAGVGQVYGPYEAGAAIGGAILGIQATMFATVSGALCALLATLIGLAAAAFGPPGTMVFGVLPVLCALTAWNAAVDGTRGFVLSLFGVVIGHGPVATGAHWPALITFGATALGGIALAWALGLAHRLPGRPGGRAYGIALFIFLWAGLAFSFAIAAHIGDPHSYWIGLMFAMRGLTPPGAHAVGTLRFGLGTVCGAAVAAALELLHIPDPVLLAFAPICAMIGMRYMGAPTPLTPALITAGLLMATAPTIASAIFRMEAAVIVAILAALFAFAVDRPLLSRRRGAP